MYHLDPRPYPRLRLAGFSPISMSILATVAASGDLPRPPTARLPMLMTGAVSRLLR